MHDAVSATKRAVRGTPTRPAGLPAKIKSPPLSIHNGHFDVPWLVPSPLQRSRRPVPRDVQQSRPKRSTTNGRKRSPTRHNAHLRIVTRERWKLNTYQEHRLTMQIHNRGISPSVDWRFTDT